MAAQSVFSHRELMNKNGSDKQEMLFQKGINWNDYDFRMKRGAVITKVEVPVIPRNMEYVNDGKTYAIDPNQIVKRNRWQVVETPTFTQDREFIKGILNTKKKENELV